MRVLLVLPQISLTSPPLGIGYIAARLKASGHMADILNTAAMPDDKLVSFINYGGYEIIGFTSMTFLMPEIYRLAKIIKKEIPSCTTICGGVHTSALPRLTLEECPDLDSPVAGEGEEVVLNFLQALEKGSNLESVNGLCFRKGNQIIPATPQGYQDLDALPFPVREMTGGFSQEDMPLRINVVRSCPRRCISCSYLKVSGSRVRRRTVKSVIQELKYLSQGGCDQVSFVDCMFTQDGQWLKDFCQALRQAKLEGQLKWEVNSTPNLLNGEKIKVLAKHGCKRVNFWTADSGNDAILRRTNKAFTTSQLREVCEQIKKYRMETFAAFLFGYPGEDANSCKKTIEFAKELNLDSYWFGIPKPFPGSELYQMALAIGEEITGNWKDYFMNPEEPPNLPAIGCSLDPQELFNFMSTARRQLPVRF